MIDLSKFNPEQKEAITFTKGNCLVSASAGSGKTSVISARATYLVQHEKVPVSSLVILTFGEAAASEMRNRIRETLFLEGLIDEANDVDNAYIMTFDAFFLDIVKRYGYKINLGLNLSILDGVVIEITKKRFLKEIIEREILDKNPLMSKLIFNFCLFNYMQILDMIYDISVTIHNRVYDVAKYYQNFEENFLSKPAYLKFIQNYIYSINNLIKEWYQTISRINDDDFLSRNENYINQVAFMKSLDELYDLFTSDYRFSGVAKLEQFDREIYNQAKDQLDKIKNIVKTYGKKEFILNNFLSTKKTAIYLLSLAKELDDKMFEYMKHYNTFDFIDIARFALKILDDEKVLDEIKHKISFIMVDEYQDTNDMQDLLINRLANNNLFMVGDIKQSIYGFRDANPRIFLNRYNNYGLAKGGQRIILFNNYRSREEVITSNNKLFSRVMNLEETGIDYLKEHQMLFGNEDYRKNKMLNYDYATEIYRYPSTYARKNLETEITFIAQDIANKIKNGFEVYHQGKLKKATNEDFAIIVDRASKFNEFIPIFRQYKLPLKIISDISVLENNVFKIFRNVLYLLLYFFDENKYGAYKHSLMSVLRSYLYRLSDEELYDIILNDRFKELEIYQTFKNLYREIKDLPLFKAVEKIIFQLDFINKLETVTNFNEYKSVIEYLYKLSKNLAKVGYSLEDLYLLMLDLEEFKIDLKIPFASDINDAVTLINSHKSKGLQYSITYLPLIDNRITRYVSSDIYRFSLDGGLALNNLSFKREEKNKKLSGFTLNKYLIDDNTLLETNLEKLRLFYVTLTRAHEKIIIIDRYQEGKNRAVTSLKVASKLGYKDFLIYGDYLSLYRSHDLKIDNQEIKQIDSADHLTKNIAVHIFDPFINNLEINQRRRASKEEDDTINEDAIYIGNKFHHYLERIDFIKKDTAFIKLDSDRKIIDKFLKNPLFINLEKVKIYHEFPFYDTENDVYGIIDLLIVKNNEINIIDFKTSNIDDPSYDYQLNVYASYLKKISSLPIKAYLVSILQNNSREVKLIND